MRKLIDLKAPGTAQTVTTPHRHESARQHVSGQAAYIDDVRTRADCLHAYVVKGPATVGTLTQLDLAGVSTAPGVVRVFTSADIPGHKDIGAIFPGDILLAETVIEYPLQPVAVVVAETHEQARRAAALVRCEVQARKPVLTAEQAHAQDYFVRPKHEQSHGNVSAQYAQVSHTLEGTLTIGGQEHFYLESQAALVEPMENDCLLVHSSTQHPSEVQKVVSEVLNLPLHRITVETRRMGGGFGGKESQAAPYACLAALAAYFLKRAIKIRLARSDDMQLTGKRHAFVNHYKIGFDADGRILASQFEINGLCGYTPDLSDAIVDRAMFHADNAYYLGAAHVIGHRLKTDTVSHTAFRGFGGPQGMLAIEHALDSIACRLGKDPLDIRLLNLYGAEGRQDNLKTHYGMQIEGFWLAEIIDRLAQNCEYRNRKAEFRAFNQSSPIIKKGLALTPVKFGISFTAKHLNQAGALIHIYTDGSIQVNHGGTEMGQGLHTKIGTIVAREFGVDIDRILVTPTRTDKVPNTSPTAASSGTDLNGMAAKHAAVQIKERLQQHLAEKYQVSADHIVFADNQVSGPGFSLAFDALIQEAYFARVNLSANGFYQTPKIGYDHEKGQGRPFFYFSQGAACAEVWVDTLTGEYKVHRVDILHDVGESLNPDIDRGQISGGFIQGMGWLTTEELVWNDQGALLSNSPMNYKIPAISDTPEIFNIDLFQRPNNEATIYHSKAVGEPPFMLPMCVWSAIRDAISSLSQYQHSPHLDTPATTERVFMAIQAMKQAVVNE
ncbi:xanthine dehydrogenase molybdopterin binding subunit [Gynuella sp.]|uniref:xanthine dehydrogenase molybdopterin binding subunit n=1 Tax=Gynuella sp. TaxID=2969146 RepID=UPI003D0E89C1